LAVWLGGNLDSLERATWSWRVRWFANHTPFSPQIKIILIDQASLDWAKQENSLGWPWPRELYTAVLDFCSRAGAKAVVFDMLYTEPSIFGVEDDKRLGEAIGRTKGFVGALFLGLRSGDTNWPAEIRGTGCAVSGLETWTNLHP